MPSLGKEKPELLYFEPVKIMEIEKMNIGIKDSHFLFDLVLKVI